MTMNNYLLKFSNIIIPSLSTFYCQIAHTYVGKGTNHNCTAQCVFKDELPTKSQPGQNKYTCSPLRPHQTLYFPPLKVTSLPSPVPID